MVYIILSQMKITLSFSTTIPCSISLCRLPFCLAPIKPSPRNLLHPSLYSVCFTKRDLFWLTEKTIKAERKVALTKKYGSSVATRILEGKIWIGMTEQMLLESWGQPEDINTTVTRYSSRKQYVYGSGRYVYVENGKVDAWQN